MTGTEEQPVTDHREVAEWVEASPFSKLLGLTLDEVSADSARLSLPFKEELSNGDTALHGGVAGSTIAAAAGCVARAALGTAAGPWHTAAIQVSYLSAALGEGLVGSARLLRRGKELAFVEVDVESESGKAVAKGLVTVRGRLGADPVEQPRPGRPDEPGSPDPGPMGPFIGSIPFHAALGIAAEHMAGGRSRIVMPAAPGLGDGAGGTNEGAVLTLIDTTGAMAAWAKTGPGRYKASTANLQARLFGPAPEGDLVGLGRVVHHDREALFCDVEIRRSGDGSLVATGNVNYRIVTPETAGQR